MRLAASPPPAIDCSKTHRAPPISRGRWSLSTPASRDAPLRPTTPHVSHDPSVLSSPSPIPPLKDWATSQRGRASFRDIASSPRAAASLLPLPLCRYLRFPPSRPRTCLSRLNLPGPTGCARTSGMGVGERRTRASLRLPSDDCLSVYFFQRSVFAGMLRRLGSYLCVCAHPSSRGARSPRPLCEICRWLLQIRMCHLRFVC